MKLSISGGMNIPAT